MADLSINFLQRMLLPVYSSYHAQTYYGLALYLFLAVAICGLLATLAYLFSLSAVQDSEKRSEYECGFEPFDSATRLPFDVHFYLVGILFLIFDVEISLLFPGVLSLRTSGGFGFYLMLGFIVILAVGFLYEGKRGALIWPSRQKEHFYNSGPTSNLFGVTIPCNDEFMLTISGDENVFGHYETPFASYAANPPYIEPLYLFGYTAFCIGVAFLVATFIDNNESKFYMNNEYAYIFYRGGPTAVKAIFVSVLCGGLYIDPLDIYLLLALLIVTWWCYRIVSGGPGGMLENTKTFGHGLHATDEDLLSEKNKNKVVLARGGFISNATLGPALILIGYLCVRFPVLKGVNEFLTLVIVYFYLWSLYVDYLEDMGEDRLIEILIEEEVRDAEAIQRADAILKGLGEDFDEGYAPLGVLADIDADVTQEELDQHPKADVGYIS